MPPARDLLRVLTCGSVDDGKSSLIGRLLYDAGLIPNDHLAQLERESRNRQVGPEGLDLSLLVDGLEAEREQGITIDVAYRYFATAARAFIVADAPGHEQYTRNMVTGASTSELVLVVVDARAGVLTQTARHTLLAALFGIRDAVLLVNKMDLIDWSAAVFHDVEQAYARIASDAGIARVTAIPVSALHGGNVVNRSHQAPWFTGPTLLSFLEEVTVPPLDVAGPLALPVQWVNRSHGQERGYAGTIARGTVGLGDLVRVAAKKQSSRVARILMQSGDGERAKAGDAVTLVLTDAIDVSRGDVLVHADAPLSSADLFQAHLTWLHDDPMIPGRTYLARFGTALVPTSILELKHRIDPSTFETLAAKTLAINEVGVVKLATDHPIAFAPYAENRALGGFILIDRLTNATVGAGMVDFALHRAQNLHWESFDVTRERRAAIKGQAPAILWFTGLSGAGKSTIANIIDRKLTLSGRHTYVLDGDNIRHGLNRDLGFTDADRVENVRRVAHVARLMADAGLIVLVSFISPFARERMLARETAGNVPFLEIFVDTPLAVCEARDSKGLYHKARAGQIVNFTGISSDYEVPLAPDLHLKGDKDEPEPLAEAVLRLLRDHGLIG